jgi:hypothetical protein
MRARHPLVSSFEALSDYQFSHRILRAEVRFKDYGLKSIEVLDNGSGISPNDYDSVGALSVFEL